MSAIIETLESSLQEMAASMSVEFHLWNKHSNAVLALILDNDNLKSQISNLVEDVQSKDALLAEMSGALAQIMSSSARPDHDEFPNLAKAYDAGLERARAVQESYSLQLGNG